MRALSSLDDALAAMNGRRGTTYHSPSASLADARPFSIVDHLEDAAGRVLTEQDRDVLASVVRVLRKATLIDDGTETRILETIGR